MGEVYRGKNAILRLKDFTPNEKYGDTYTVKIRSKVDESFNFDKVEYDADLKVFKFISCSVIEDSTNEKIDVNSIRDFKEIEEKDVLEYSYTPSEDYSYFMSDGFE